MPGQTDRIMADLEAFVEGEVRGVAADVVQELSSATPKDTGWAAASWKSEIGQQVQAPIKPAGVVGQAKAEQIARLVELLGYRIQQGEIHVNNTAGYVAEIEERTPFVEDAIDRAIAGRQAGVVRRR